MTNDDKNSQGDTNKKRPGPDPERLKLDDEDWRDAVKRFFPQQKPRPENADRDGDEELREEC